MARKALIEKEKRREKKVKLAWEKRQALKKRVIDSSLSDEEREDARIQLNKMPRDTSPTRLRNRCKLTGRSRGYLRKFKVSRNVFREKASYGYIPGMTKSSW